MEADDELREAVAEYNRARTSLQRALQRGLDGGALDRVHARVAAAEARLKSAQAKGR